ncbi:unnamed protein product [Phytophthora fragariaefolia]|uniref:Unnamed protein product n=1 Tax=Phytophthora fragariaefolia TaxID=1490495 RepID=A0A9W6U7L2_9STRA|nr:unnamed protein product [Phytophthora fragariaefolia]
MSRHPTSREYLVGEKVHVDAWGPYAQPSFGGKRYFVVFVDDASRFVTVYLFEHRSEVYEKFEAYYERVKTQLDVRMKGLRSDNAKEFQHLQNTCESKYGMEFDSSVKHTPEQNGVAERMIRTITEKMRCMLLHFDLPELMWGEAALTATYCVNILPSSARGLEVPYAVWYRKVLAYEKLRTFGCAALAYVDKVERHKMETKAKEDVFVGYSREKRGYRLLDSKTNKFRHTVVFYETKAGRVLNGSNSTHEESVSDYLGGVVEQDDIQPILDEMRVGNNCGDESRDRTGGADVRIVRSGGADDGPRPKRVWFLQITDRPEDMPSRTTNSLENQRRDGSGRCTATTVTTNSSDNHRDGGGRCAAPTQTSHDNQRRNGSGRCTAPTVQTQVSNEPAGARAPEPSSEVVTIGPESSTSLLGGDSNSEK